MNNQTESRELTAYHEAGHAVADVHFDFDCMKVSIKRDAAAHAMGAVECLAGWDSEEGLKNSVISRFAGFAAEDHRGPGADKRGSLGDFAAAEELLQMLEPDRYQKDKEALVEEWLARTREFVTRPETWKRIDRVARELLEREELDDLEIDSLIAIADGEPGAEEGLARYRAMRGI